MSVWMSAIFAECAMGVVEEELWATGAWVLRRWADTWRGGSCCRDDADGVCVVAMVSCSSRKARRIPGWEEDGYRTRLRSVTAGLLEGVGQGTASGDTTGGEGAIRQCVGGEED